MILQICAVIFLLTVLALPFAYFLLKFRAMNPEIFDKKDK